MEYLEWVQAVVNQQNHQATTITSSAFSIIGVGFILTLYFLSFSRSKLYTLAYIAIAIFDNLISRRLNLNPVDFYSHLACLQIVLFFLIFLITKTNSKSQFIVCGMIVTLDVLMAVGYLVGGDFALFIYDNYENIVFCLHVMLILSLYKPKPILRALADKLLDFFRAVDSIIFMRAFWYTKEISKQEFKLS